jgi:CheY-like chemotaxis protein
MNGLILIADSHAARGEAVAVELEERGHDVRVAEHGVAALERALGDGPKLVIAAHGLPLVDAPRLAELVGSNPRTRDARFLFLGEPEQGTRFAMGLGDEQVPATLRPADIADVACELLERQERIADFDALTGKGEHSSGTLEQLSLADLVRLLHVGGKSGCLEVEHQDPTHGPLEGAIWVRDGEIIDARTGSAEREKALFRMLTWKDGDFAFAPGQSDAPPRMRVATRALLAEGVRQIKEWSRRSTQLPQLDALIRLRVSPAELPAGIHPLTQEVLAQLETYQQVGEVVDHCTFPDYQVLRTLQTLEERGLVALSRAQLPAEPLPESGLFSSAQVRRLREWVRDTQGRPREPRDARLVVAASDPAALADFANLLRPIPGVTLSAEMERGAIAPDDLAPLGRVRIDERLGIELVHVPSLARFAPFWTRAGHGSLGALFLLSGAVGEAVTRLQPMVAAMQRLPRMRLFHAAMLAKGDRLSPNELRENLSLFDDASLFLLPLEASKDPASLVVRMFARMVP